MEHDARLTDPELNRLLTAVRPAWRIETADAAPSEAGQHAVYRLAVDAPDGPRECYLKATPDGKDPTVDLEARVLAVLNAQTDLPVPSVYGAVDRDDDLPTPFALLEALPGDAVSRTNPSALSERAHRRIAREVGRRLAALHALDAVDAFGFVTYRGPELRGESPGGDPDSLTVADPTADWRDCLREWASGTVAGLRESRFADLAAAADRALDARIDDLDGPFEPVFARIDQSPENLLVADGAVTAMIDWEFAVAATPAYDVVHVAESLAGGPFAFAPSVTDRRAAVFEAVLNGYRDRGPDRVLRQVRVNRESHELLSALRAMANLDEWYPMVGLGGERDDAAAALRAEVAPAL